MTHYARMYGLAFRILHNEDAAKDIVHEVFSSLLDNIPKSINESYLLMSVRSRSLNYIRNISIHDKVKELYAVDENEIEDEVWPDEDIISQLNSIIDSHLTDTCRKVVLLRFRQEMTYEEIGHSLGISKVAVYKHLRNAITILRNNLSNNG